MNAAVKTESYRAGTDTGSLCNLLMSGSRDLVPEVGMGATILGWTDRRAATIVEVGNKRVGIREDIAIRTDKNGMSDSQDYRYEQTEGPATQYFTLRKNGAWVAEGSSMKGTRLSIGERNHYYDYSF